MKSKASRRFWNCYNQLPSSVQSVARKNYQLWLKDHRHPSLHFKKLHGSDTRFSVRVGDRYRAIGEEKADSVVWVWIGTHEDYNKLLKR